MSGCSGIPRKISQGFSEEELKFDIQTSPAHSSQQFSIGEKSSATVLSKDIHRLVPKSGGSVSRSSGRFEFFYVLVLVTLSNFGMIFIVWVL